MASASGSQPEGTTSRASTSDASPPELGALLQAQLLRELSRAWHEINASFFKHGLTPPVLRLTASDQLLGRWEGARRTIAISLPLLLQSPWGSVVEVLKHEMAHQYVDEVLKATEEPAHGPAFREVCARMGVHPAASGLPTSDEPNDPARSRLLKRVGALLALADSPNLHEAKTATAVAQRLMLKHNIELARERAERAYEFRHLGRPSGRVPESDHILAGILAEHFFVEAIWVSAYRPEDGKRGSLLEICGTRENLEIASHAYAFLRGTAERLWVEHRRLERLRSNRDRRTFVAGVMEGFRERLKAEKRSCREQGLVWVRDADLRQHHRRRHPHVRQVRLQGHARNEARDHGRAAGRKIVLRRGLQDQAPGDAGGVPPKRLPAGRKRGRG